MTAVWLKVMSGQWLVIAASRPAEGRRGLRRRTGGGQPLTTDHSLDVAAQRPGQLRGSVLAALADLRLVGDAGVLDAVDAFRRAAAAEAELVRRRVADRP